MGVFDLEKQTAQQEVSYSFVSETRGQNCQREKIMGP